jgi:hypothetical protein
LINFASGQTQWLPPVPKAFLTPAEAVMEIVKQGTFPALFHCKAGLYEAADPAQ